MLACVAAGFTTAAAAPAPTGPAKLPAVSDAAISASVTDIVTTVTDIVPTVTDIVPTVTDLVLPVTDVASTERSGTDTVMSLRTDILFAFGKSRLPAAADARIARLVQDIGKGTRVQVYGHTDTIGSEASNQTLSEARAKAVAAAIRTARPDLVLDVRGFGENRPVAANSQGGKDNPQGRAQNRRVEIRFAS